MDEKMMSKIKSLHGLFQELNKMKKVRHMSKSTLEVYMMSMESLVNEMYDIVEEEEAKKQN